MNVDKSRERFEKSDAKRKRKVDDLPLDASAKLHRSNTDDETMRDSNDIGMQGRYGDILSGKTIHERKADDMKQATHVLPGSAVQTTGLSLTQQGSIFRSSLDTIGGLQLGKQLALLGSVGDFTGKLAGGNQL
jgi:hypothetical protein